MKINERVDRLERAIEIHLQESGEIRTDIKWLKKAFFAIIGLGTVFAGCTVTVMLELLFRTR